MTMKRTFKSTAAVALLTGTTLVGAGTALSPSAGAIGISGTVLNSYRCSNQTKQCWQVNPPHDPNILNSCTWTNDYIVNAAYGPTTCGRKTPR